MSKDVLVIIPTVRNVKIVSKYVKNALKHKFDIQKLFFLLLTEDYVDKNYYSSDISDSGVEGLVLNQSDRIMFLNNMGLSRYNNIFPRQSHAETSFGLFYMYVNVNFKYGIMIDDDTEPASAIDYFGQHLNNLSYSGQIKTASSDHNWVNVLWENFNKHKLYPRGFPYSMMGESISVYKKTINRVCISQGLWTNIPDLDAVRILIDGDLNGQSRTRLKNIDFGENFSVDVGNYQTVCSMNVALKREILPAFYQYKMDDNPWRIGRFDDIWSGIVAKKVMDNCGWSIINGNPLCIHNKAPRSTFKDLKSEVPGIEANEIFFKEVNGAPSNCNDIFESSEAIYETLQLSNHEFISYCGSFLGHWLDLLRKAN